MIDIVILIITVVGLSYHVREVAPERGRNPVSWVALTIGVSLAGSVIGAGLLGAVVASETSPLAALVLNPVVFGCAAAVAVVIALHRLPVAAVELSGEEWELDRLDTGERVHVSLRGSVRIRSDNDELVLERQQIRSVAVDGECVVLELAAEASPKRVRLLPIGQASRAMRQSFAEALRTRIQRYLLD